MSELPRVLVCSPVRIRPELSDCLPEFLAALQALDYPNREMLILQHECWGDDPAPKIAESGLAVSWERVIIGDYEDSRQLGGSRSTGETQETLAYLRSRLFGMWQRNHSDCDLCLMVDSDVILRPQALARLVAILGTLGGDRHTVTLQIDNRVRADHPPVTNATTRASDSPPDSPECPPNGRNVSGEGWDAGLPPEAILEARSLGRASPARVIPQDTGTLSREYGTPMQGVRVPYAGGTEYVPVPWATDGRVTRVDRAGACTLYPRSALARRFRWDPRYREEHMGLFDDLSDMGFRHWLLQDPSLVEHRMKRQPEPMAEVKRLRAAWDLEHPEEDP